MKQSPTQSPVFTPSDTSPSTWSAEVSGGAHQILKSGNLFEITFLKMSHIQGKIHTFYECAKTHSYENQPLMVSQRVPLSGLVITSPTRCWFRPSWGCKQRGKYYALLKSEMKNEKSDLKGSLHAVLRHLRLQLLGCRHFLWQVAQHKERLVCRNANKLARVGPKDLRAQRGKKREICYTRNMRRWTEETRRR